MYEEQPQKREGREVWRKSIDFEGKWAKVIDRQFGGGIKILENVYMTLFNIFDF